MQREAGMANRESRIANVSIAVRNAGLDSSAGDSGRYTGRQEASI